MELTLILIVMLVLLSKSLTLCIKKIMIKSFSSLLLVSSLQLPIISPVVKAESTSYITNAKGFYNSWNSKDIEKAISYFADDIIFNDAQYNKPFKGKKEVKTIYKNVLIV